MNSKIRMQLNKIMSQDYTRFHMPGHKGRDINNVEWIKYDFTEITGSDNLSKPQGIIKEVLNDMSNLYNSKATFMLVNGSTTGIIASLLTVCEPGDSFIIQRNSHRAVYSGMVLNHIHPIYIYPTVHEIFGYGLAIDPNEVEKLIIMNPSIKGIVVTSPTYYGTCSDIKTILEIVRKYNKILIVDEAHGPHFSLNNRYPVSSVKLGADIVIQSTHKVLNTMTQTGLIHVCSNRINLEELSERINMIQSSSPSYPMMISIEEGVRHAFKFGNTILEEVYQYYQFIKGELEEYSYLFIGDRLVGEKSVAAFDWMKLWFLCPQIKGNYIDKILRERYNIQMEMNDRYTITGMMGLGTEKRDVIKLIDGLKKITKDSYIHTIDKTPPIGIRPYPRVELYIDPWKAFWGKKKVKNINNCIGEICGTFIIPYPPGIPIIAPGEILTKEVIEYINTLDHNNVIGLGEEDSLLILES